MKNKFSINLEVTLVEIILSILIFAIAGVISLNCFIIARFTQIKANDKVIAGNIIQSNIEMIKSMDNLIDTEEFLQNNFQLIKSENNIHTYINFYDKNWNVSNKTDNDYFITVIIKDDSINNGIMKNITSSAGRVKPYPFINKNNNNRSIFMIETKKFFPS